MATGSEALSATVESGGRGRRAGCAPAAGREKTDETEDTLELEEYRVVGTMLTAVEVWRTSILAPPSTVDREDWVPAPGVRGTLVVGKAMTARPWGERARTMPWAGLGVPGETLTANWPPSLVFVAAGLQVELA